MEKKRVLHKIHTAMLATALFFLQLKVWTTQCLIVNESLNRIIYPYNRTIGSNKVNEILMNAMAGQLM